MINGASTPLEPHLINRKRVHSVLDPINLGGQAHLGGGIVRC